MPYQVLSKYRSELMGVAILWVMLFHAQDLDLGSSLLNGFRRLGFGGVDIFILLSSMGLVMSLARREQDYASFMARRASRVLPAFYVVMVPYTLFLITQERAVWSTLFWNSTLLYDWVQPMGAFNWYVSSSMTFYAITPLCFRFLRRQSPPRWKRTLFVAGGILLSLMISQQLMIDGFWNRLGFAYRIPLFLLGLLMGFCVLEERRLAWKDILFWSLWAVLGGAYLAVVLLELAGNPPFFPLCHLFLFTTVPMCLVLCWLFERLPLGWLRKPLRFLGTYSLEIYLLNVTLFSEVTLLRQFVSFGPTNRLYYLLSFAANIALAPVLHQLVELLRRAWRKRRDREAPSG